jgi:hypothetical protein
MSGHNASIEDRFKVYTVGQKRRVTPEIKRRRRHHRRARRRRLQSPPLIQWLRLLPLRILMALTASV